MTDNRDLIYAFVGLADPEYVIEADYSAASSICKVLVQATERYITVDNSLAVLQWTVLRCRLGYGLRLPSWAPDWTRGTWFDEDYQQMSALV